MGSILEHLETPLVIVGAAFEGKKNGMTAAWVTQVSFSPPLIAVSIAPERYTHALIEDSGAFAITVLREGQEKVARALGFSSGAKGGKLDPYKVRECRSGSPIIEDAAAYYDCRVIAKTVAGDHTIFIGEVVEEGTLKGGPYLTFRVKDYF